MKLLFLVLAIAGTVIGVALSLFGVITLVALTCANSAEACAFVSLFIGSPLAILGIPALVEFWPGHKD